MRFTPIVVIAFGLLAIGDVGAQGLPPTTTHDAHAATFSAALTSAQKAAARGDMAEAAAHFAAALAIDPAHFESWIGLITAAGDDAASRTLAVHGAHRALVDSRGRVRTERRLRDLTPKDDPRPTRLAEARAAAAAEIVAFATRERRRLQRSGGVELLRSFVGPVVRELYGESPGLRDAMSMQVEAALAPPTGDDRSLMAEIESFMNEQVAAGRWGPALRAALILQGLHRQAAQRDLVGPQPPKLDDKQSTSARATIERARSQLAEEPLTIEQLAAMSEEERETFTLTHRDWTRPGVAVSAGGLYRVETTCGFETLLGVAETVELHHRRLAKFFGADPFQTRQGVIRVVPEAHDLEAQGSPYWWAGGFQGGDVTTVVFAVGNIEGLGHTITHELTHRFDGTLHPFQPAWLTEGKATWTGGAYAASFDEDFVREHASYGQIESALLKGYGAKDKLVQLIEGTIEDYRDNYPAGYALYVYLTTWESSDGRRLFAGEFDDYVRGLMKGRREPLRWFTECFADGEGGRPEDLDVFAAGFAEFLRGFHWLSRAEWVQRYASSAGRPPHANWVYDTPTWIYSRQRAEPYFGQDQFRVAGELFAEFGKDDGAIRLWLRSLELDEWRPEVITKLGDLLSAAHRDDDAWMLAAEAARRHVSTETPPPAPFIKGLAKTRALIAALDEATAFYRMKGQGLLEARFDAERRLLARHFAVAQSEADLDRPQSTALADAVFDPPQRRIDYFGWVEDRLTGYDEFRVPELWFVDVDGDLHVGRAKPREGTGSYDPRAHRRHAYVRTRDVQDAGRYVIETRISFTTSFVDGAVVLGHDRRDRNTRFTFSAGDYMVAIGEKDEQPKFESVSWSLRGLRDRDGGLPGSTPGGRFDFGAARTSFRLRLEVDGAEVMAWIEDRLVGCYHTVDGQTITGAVGFAASFGAFEAQAPRIRRQDRRGLADLLTSPHRLDLARDGNELIDSLLNRHMDGHRPAKTGDLAIFIPYTVTREGEFDVDDVVLSTRHAVRGVRAGLEREGLPKRLVVILPRSLPEEARDTVAGELADDESTIITSHERKTYLFDLKQPNMPHEPMPVLLFIDPTGVLRLAEIYAVGREGLPDRYAHWVRVFRNG